MQDRGGKRAAPISASAFSFSLGAGGKKPKPPPKETPRQPPPKPLPPPRKEPRALDTPRSGITSHALFSTPTRESTPARPAGPLPSPFDLHNGSPAPSRTKRISALLDDEASPFRTGKKEEKTALSAMPRMGPMEKSERRVIETEEGVGVSPRKFKGNIVHKGPGPPLSQRVQSFASSSNTSLILFYTSLQHTLYPSTSTRSSSAGSACAAHIRKTAAIRLRILNQIPGPTHHATMAECRVSSWGSDPQSSVSDTVLVVFQSLPPDCPRLGVDPRAATPKCEVGIWAPWSDTLLPDSAGGKSTRALFASRYLVAEAA